jgi:hypothetical protein
MDRFPFKLEPNQLGTSHLIAERRLHAIQCKLERDPDLKIKYHKFTKEYEELGHWEPVNSQMGRRHVIVQHIIHFFKETNFTTKTLIVFDRNAKSSNCLQHHSNESYLWTDLIVLTWIQGSSDKWKTFVDNRVAIIQEETSAIWRRAVSIQSCLSNLKRN